MSQKIYKTFGKKHSVILHPGDCKCFIKEIPDGYIDLTVTSPPYFMGKDYDTSKDIGDFIKFHEEFLPEIVRITKDGGSICWQVGYHVRNKIITPLDYHIYQVLSEFNDIFLRNRIIWTYGFGLHGKSRFSGRHEVILWFTKGNKYDFNLDAVRVPQKYPGKRYYKGAKKGQPSCNPKGKNPSDVWNIPNVKANHVEKTDHPCQFPIGLVQRLIRALTNKGDVVFDPFAGSGTSLIAAILEKRKAIGCENNDSYYSIAEARCIESFSNQIKYRELDRQILTPNLRSAVARAPEI